MYDTSAITLYVFLVPTNSLYSTCYSALLSTTHRDIYLGYNVIRFLLPTNFLYSTCYSTLLSTTHRDIYLDYNVIRFLLPTNSLYSTCYSVLLSTTHIGASTSDIATLPVIISNIIFR